MKTIVLLTIKFTEKEEVKILYGQQPLKKESVNNELLHLSKTASTLSQN